ncbi:MAG: glycoside hydrolase family 2 TIM barrel-domain containing protein [Woeseiaceae bacterium]|jgi:hypothetical protein
MYRITIGLIIAFLFGSCVASVPGDQDTAPGSRVQVIEQPDGTFTLLRNGEPYLVKGAGTGSGEGLGSGDLKLLAASGGNSVRTWGIAQLDELVDGKPFLDRAHELGISVAAGFWVQHVRHGFDYSDSDSIQRQRDRLRDAVLKYRDHPALLAWGLGNEMEAFEPNVEGEVIWRELNHLAGIIKDLDPHHPVMTVIAGAQPAKIAGILEHYPNMDILGVNSYSSAPMEGQRLVGMGWNGPYMLTEYGVTGTWEVPETPWGAPVEPDPSTKAAETYTAYTMNRDNNVGRSLGSYVFYWGHKQEATATWFGMFLPSGEKLPRVDAMAYAWSGEWPDNRAPKLQSLETPVAFNKVKPGISSYAEVSCIDREGDELRYFWDIRSESSDRKIGGDTEAAPPSFSDAIEEGHGTPRIVFKAPNLPGAYRVFVTAFDGKGGAVTHNLPFYVEN